MEKIEVTNQNGEVVDTPQLLASLTSSSPLSPLHLSLVYRSYNENQHQNTKKVKRRGEVKGSTRKIYKQKGTGGARHGARSAPQFRGGGVAFGPTGQRRGSLKVNQKLKKKVLQSLLGEKIRQQNLIVVDQITLD